MLERLTLLQAFLLFHENQALMKDHHANIFLLVCNNPRVHDVAPQWSCTVDNLVSVHSNMIFKWNSTGHQFITSHRIAIYVTFFSPRLWTQRSVLQCKQYFWRSLKSCPHNAHRAFKVCHIKMIISVTISSEAIQHCWDIILGIPELNEHIRCFKISMQNSMIK
jgi:hypothetical protein